MASALPNLPSIGFQAIAETYNWLRRNGLTIEDAERTIITHSQDPDGCTVGELVRAFLDDHGISLDHEDKVRQLVTFFAHLGVIERMSINRFRSTLPPESAHILAVVSIPPDEFEAIRPYIYRGRAVWVAAAGG